jgi:hypothetical protein
MKSLVRSENETRFRNRNYRYVSTVSIYRIVFTSENKNLVGTSVPAHISASHDAYQMMADVSTIVISRWGNSDGGNFGPLWDPYNDAKRNKSVKRAILMLSDHNSVWYQNSNMFHSASNSTTMHETAFENICKTNEVVIRQKNMTETEQDGSNSNSVEFRLSYSNRRVTFFTSTVH